MQLSAFDLASSVAINQAHLTTNISFPYQLIGRLDLEDLLIHTDVLIYYKLLCTASAGGRFPLEN